MDILHILIFAAPVIALIFAGISTSSILKHSDGTEKMKKIAEAIQQGAMAFLRTEYTILFFFHLIGCRSYLCFYRSPKRNV